MKIASIPKCVPKSTANTVTRAICRSTAVREHLRRFGAVAVMYRCLEDAEKDLDCQSLTNILSMVSAFCSEQPHSQVSPLLLTLGTTTAPTNDLVDTFWSDLAETWLVKGVSAFQPCSQLTDAAFTWSSFFLGVAIFLNAHVPIPSALRQSYTSSGEFLQRFHAGMLGNRGTAPDDEVACYADGVFPDADTSFLAYAAFWQRLEKEPLRCLRENKAQCEALVWFFVTKLQHGLQSKGLKGESEESWAALAESPGMVSQ